MQQSIDADEAVSAVKITSALLADVEGLFALAPLAAQLYDCEGTSAWMNEAQRALLGLPDTRYGVGAYNVLADPWSVANGYAGAYALAFAGEPIYLPEVVVNLADSENSWDTRREVRVLTQILVPLPDGSGRVRAVLSLTSDVTDLQDARRGVEQLHEGIEQRSLARTYNLATALAQLQLEAAARQKAEASLAEREELAQALFSNAAIGMALLDPQGRLLLVNDAFARFLDTRPLELVGIKLDTLVHPDDREADALPRAELLSGVRRSYSADTRFLARSGGVVWGHLSVSLLRDVAGQPRLTVVVCEDITARLQADAERARLERRLQEAQHLEGMGVLAGGVAHDFNNILTSIQGNADLALLSLPDDSPARAYLSQITRAVRQASELTAQMLSYAGRRRAPIGPIDINQAIGEIGDLLRAGHTRHCRVCFRLGAGLPLVRADATQVRQVVMNLVVNAAEAIGGSGGEIVVSTERDELGRAALDGLVLGTAAAAGSLVRVSVTDTGCGMDPATMARIFEPSFTTKLFGHGLGLAAVHSIVREHTGALWVQSTPGLGTSFHVWLPAA